MKHLLMVLIMLLVASVTLSAKPPCIISAPDLTVNGDTIFVPINLENTYVVGGIVLPLGWTEGFTLVDVNFEGTRLDHESYLQIVDINNETNKALIVSILGLAFSPWLEEASGVVAKLTFVADDPFDYFEVYPDTIHGPIIEDPMRPDVNNIVHELLLAVINYHNNVAGLVPKVESMSTGHTNVEEIKNTLPISFELSQNYPNPFNPSTVIDYALPCACHVNLVVYNTLGQKVATLVNCYQSAGYYSIVWDASNISSGMYFYLIDTGTYKITKKMVVLK